MSDPFDPYRESLVVETRTVWPDDILEAYQERQAELEQALHASAEEAENLEYVRVHSGFCRQITVEEADLTRLEN